MRTVRPWALAGLAVVLLTAAAAADTAKETEPPQGGFTTDKLGETLKKLGYDAKPGSLPGSYLINVTRDGTTYYTRVLLSSDRTNLWLNVVVLELPNAAQ